MSEIYFSPPSGHSSRYGRGSFDDSYVSDEDEWERLFLEERSNNETEERHPINIEYLRKLMRRKNPHGE